MADTFPATEFRLFGPRISIVVDGRSGGNRRAGSLASLVETCFQKGQGWGMTSSTKEKLEKGHPAFFWSCSYDRNRVLKGREAVIYDAFL